jgi:hypothetical protein
MCGGGAEKLSSAPDSKTGTAKGRSKEQRVTAVRKRAANRCSREGERRLFLTLWKGNFQERRRRTGKDSKIPRFENAQDSRTPNWIPEVRISWKIDSLCSFL